jgi:hypothetical protein
MDSDGYGYSPDDQGVARLLEDLRTVSPLSIERMAQGWEQHALPHLERHHTAEKAALEAIEGAHLTTEWEEWQRTILDLTEGRASLVSWKVEHGQTGHHAEAATLSAGLALLAADHLDHAHAEMLVRPAAEALPWLLTVPRGAPS